MLRYKWTICLLLANAALMGWAFSAYGGHLPFFLSFGSVLTACAYVWLGATHVD
jgi:hypothetical protein